MHPIERSELYEMCLGWIDDDGHNEGVVCAWSNYARCVMLAADMWKNANPRATSKYS